MKYEHILVYSLVNVPNISTYLLQDKPLLRTKKGVQTNILEKVCALCGPLVFKTYVPHGIKYFW